MLRKTLVMLTAVLIVALPAYADVFKMDLHASYGATSFHTQGAMEFAELVKKYSDGTVEITVHPGGSLGFKGPELLKVVKDAQVPMSDILMGVVAGSEHAFGISSLPRLVPDFAKARSLYDDSRSLYEKGAEKWGQKFLYAAPWPPSGLVTKNPVSVKADLSNLKTRTYDKNGAEFLRILGASPVSLPWGEVYSSLRTGMIDSVLTSAESTKNGKFWEVLGAFKPINYAFPLNMVTINNDYWKSLNKSQQDAVLKAAAEIEASQWAASEQRHVDSMKVIEENGIAVSEVSAELSAELDKAAAALIDEFKSSSSDEVKALLDKYTK